MIHIQYNKIKPVCCSDGGGGVVSVPPHFEITWKKMKKVWRKSILKQVVTHHSREHLSGKSC
jgi:hypothetical protein